LAVKHFRLRKKKRSKKRKKNTKYKILSVRNGTLPACLEEALGFHQARYLFSNHLIKNKKTRTGRREKKRKIRGGAEPHEAPKKEKTGIPLREPFICFESDKTVISFSVIL
jgi:hypothetical protein